MRPLAWRQGMDLRVPMGQTVSRWPSRSNGLVFGVERERGPNRASSALPKLIPLEGLWSLTRASSERAWLAAKLTQALTAEGVSEGDSARRARMGRCGSG